MREIFLKIEWNYLYIWVKFSWKLCEIMLKVSEILFKMAWNPPKNCMKFS